MIARSLKGKILVFAVFFIGIATGVLITNFYETRVSGNRAETTDSGERVKRARSDAKSVHEYLGLNQEQREKVDKILEDTRSEVRSFREETNPRLQAIQEACQAKIRALLNEEQLRKYEEFRKNLQERRKNRASDHNRSDRRN